MDNPSAVLDEIVDYMLCKICKTHESNYLFVSCGHICCCFQCVLTQDNCPICRCKITGIMKVFKS